MNGVVVVGGIGRGNAGGGKGGANEGKGRGSEGARSYSYGQWMLFPLLSLFVVWRFCCCFLSFLSCPLAIIFPLLVHYPSFPPSTVVRPRFCPSSYPLSTFWPPVSTSVLPSGPSNTATSPLLLYRLPGVRSRISTNLPRIHMCPLEHGTCVLETNVAGTARWSI